MRSHLPIFERPAIPFRLASSYSCSRFRSSRRCPADPPLLRPRAACWPRERRVASGRFAMVRAFLAAVCAFRMFDFAALTCRCVAMSISFRDSSMTECHERRCLKRLLAFARDRVTGTPGPRSAVVARERSEENLGDVARRTFTAAVVAVAVVGFVLMLWKARLVVTLLFLAIIVAA